MPERDVGKAYDLFKGHNTCNFVERFVQSNLGVSAVGGSGVAGRGCKRCNFRLKSLQM